MSIHPLRVTQVQAMFVGIFTTMTSHQQGIYQSAEISQHEQVLKILENFFLSATI